jgi:predicted dehydrogenase
MRTASESTTIDPRFDHPLTSTVKPRLGFMGTGWIGRLRMEALRETKSAEFAAVFDPSPEAAQAAAALQDNTRISDSFEALLDSDVDGVVIATPSALHASQCEQALRKGKAVFCQKPLARTRRETEGVVNAARKADKLLGVDFSYRHLAGMDQLRELIRAGELGEIFAADLVFHNAYGPDKPWFYDVKSAGGGCVMDLGIHLVDSLFWLLDRRDVDQVDSQLYAQGRKLEPPLQEVEDYAAASLVLGDTHARLCCSWNLHAGQDAVIETRLYGTKGGAAIRNVGGSFFDFEIHRFDGTSTQQLAGYPDDWGGGALGRWVEQLALSDRYDSEVEQAVKVADVIDRIYRR